MLDKKVSWDFIPPYDKILYYKQKFPSVFRPSGRGGEAAAVPSADERLIMLKVLDDARTFFKEKN